MASAADGSLYVAYNRFSNDADSLQIQRLCDQQGALVRSGEWQVVGGAGTYILGINAVAAGDRVAVTYATERGQNWDIHAVLCGPDGPGEPIVMTDAAGVDVKPAAAWHDGVLWVAWESNRNGFRQIFVSSLRGSAVADTAGKSVKIEVNVRCPAPSARSNCVAAISISILDRHKADSATVTFVDEQPPEGRCFYYVRVIQVDEEIAWSSPVWFGVTDNGSPGP